MFPEAGVSASFTVRELKTGAVRMAREAGVPIVPMAIWGGQLLKTKNHPTRIREAFHAAILVGVGAPLEVAASDDPETKTRQLRTGMQTMLDRVQAEYPRPGLGKWWQPEHLGGTAPSPEAAAAAEAQRQRRKAARRV